MGLTLLTTPNRTVNGLDSNLCAMKSQIPYTFLRVDFSNAAVTQFSTSIQVTVPNDGVIENGTIGQNYLLDFADTYTTGIYATNSIVNNGATTSLFFVGFTYTVDTTANVNDLEGRQNYNVAINMVDNTTGQTILPSIIRFKTKQDGSLFIDLHGLFFGFEVIEKSLRFVIQWTEFYNGEAHDSGVSPETIGLAAFEQLQHDGGSNMWERLPNLQDLHQVKTVAFTSETVIVLTGPNTEFLVNDLITYDIQHYKGTNVITFLDNPNGFLAMDFIPFEGEIFAGAGLSIGEVHRPAGLFLTDFDEPLQWLFSPRIISFMIDGDFAARTGSGTLVLNVIGRDKTGAAIEIINENFTDIGLNEYRFDRLLKVATWEATMLGGVGGTDILSETKVFTQKDICRNPVTVEWKNKQGAIEQHIFSINQLITDNVAEGLQYEPALVDTLDNINVGIGRLPLGKDQTILLTAEKITPNFYKQLKFIKESEIVNVYLDIVGLKWVRVVVVNDFVSSAPTDSSLTDFTIQLQFPTDFDYTAR